VSVLSPSRCSLPPAVAVWKRILRQWRVHSVAQRTSVLFVLLILLFPFVSPLVADQNDDSKLPPCCRRAGAHHCSVLRQSTTLGPAITASPCPSFPSFQTLTVPAPGPITASIRFRIASFISEWVDFSQLRWVPSSRSRSHQERGPPSLLS
jgi:hypothetical protein